MKRFTVYEPELMYRDSFRVTRFKFENREKTMCMVDAMRRNKV